jgi:hypothetical protein
VDVPVEQEATTQVSDAQHLWNAAAQILRAQVSEAVWHSTFSDARPVNLDGALLVVAVPSSLVKERVQGRYEAMVRDALSEVGFPGVELFIEVMPDEVEAPRDLLESLMPASQSDISDMSPAMLALEPMPTRTAADLNPRYTFEAFVTGTSNRFAHAAALGRRDAGGRTTRSSSTELRAGQDPPAPRHRQLREAELCPLPGPIRPTEVFLNEFVGRSARTPAHVQTPNLRDRRADDRRHPVHGGQGGLQESSSTRSTRCTVRTSRSSSRPIASPTRSRHSKTGCAAGSSGVSPPTSSRPTSRPVSRSFTRRPRRRR